MNLGLNSISEVTNQEIRQHSERIWACDWIMIGLLRDITPVYDANMWRIYSAEYNKSLDFLTEADMVDLCNANKKAIDAFIADNVAKRVNDIIQRWKNFSEIADDVFMGMNIPTGALTAFRAFLSYHRNDEVRDDDTSRYNAFAQLRAELLVNGITYDDAESRYPLSIEEFRKFISSIAYELECINKTHNVINTTYSDYRSRLLKCIELIKTVLLVCRGTQINRDSTYNTQLFENLLRWSDTRGPVASIVRKSSALGNLQLAHAVCLYADSKAEIKPIGEATKVTDTYRFITITLLLNRYLEEMSTRVDGKVAAVR